MKKLILSLVAMLSILAALPALATNGTWSNVTVTAIQPCTSYYCPSPGAVEVHLSAVASGGATCANGYHDWVVVDVSTPTGMFAAAVLQSARLSGSTVTIVGAGSCITGYLIETMEYLTE